MNTILLNVLPYEGNLEKITPEEAIDWLGGLHSDYSDTCDRIGNATGIMFRGTSAARALSVDLQRMVRGLTHTIKTGEFASIEWEDDTPPRDSNMSRRWWLRHVRDMETLAKESANVRDTSVERWGNVHRSFVDRLEEYKERFADVLAEIDDMEDEPEEPEEPKLRLLLPPPSGTLDREQALRWLSNDFVSLMDGLGYVGYQDEDSRTHDNLTADLSTLASACVAAIATDEPVEVQAAEGEGYTAQLADAFSDVPDDSRAYALLAQALLTRLERQRPSEDEQAAD